MNGGFGLIQVLIAIAIMAILATVTAPKLKTFLFFGKESAAKQQLATLKLAVETYYARSGNYPTNLNLITTYLENNALPNDPWNKPYTINLYDNGYEILSAGPDGNFNNTDDIKIVGK